MSSAPTSRRAVAEIDFSGSRFSAYKIGNRSIHGFWHLFSAHFRHVLVTPQRRPDSGQVAWTWREAADSRPPTPAELATVRRRLSDARVSLAGSAGGTDRDEGGGSAVATLEAQVISIVNAMVERLIGEGDPALARFVCRTDAGLMVHSWGSPVAAEPHFPDVHGGEISGTVCAASGRPIEARVVLLNKKGALLAGVDSRRDGSFGFPDVAPGTYSIQVRGRSDFPAQGTSVTLEQGSVTGLVLCAEGEPSSRHGESSGKKSVSSPWYRRPLPLAALALALVGVGGATWLYLRASSAKSSDSPGETVFQVANGPLVEGGRHDKDTTHGEIGSESAWGSFKALSRLLRSPFSRKSGQAAPGAASHPRPGYPGGPLSQPGTDGAGGQDGANGKDSPEVAMGNPPDSGSRTTPGQNPSEAVQPASESRSGGTRSQSRHPSDAPAAQTQGASSVGVAAESTRSPPASTASAGAPKGAESAPSTAAATTTRTAARKVMVAAPSAGPGDAAMAGGPSPSAAAGVDSGGPGADAGGDGTGAIASGPAGGSSNGGRAPAPGAAAQAQVSAVQIAAGPEPVADETEVAVAQAVAGGDKAVRPGPAAGEPPQRLPVNPGRTPRTPEKVQEALPAPDAEPDPQSAQVNGAPEHERPKPGADPKSGPPPKAAPHVATVVAPADDGHPGEAGSSGSSRAHHQAADTPAPASVALAPVRPTATPKAKARPGEAPIDDAEISREARPSPSAAIPGPGLVRIGRMRASRWTAQVFQDVILPTRPVPISDAEAVDGMREALKRERLSGMPPSLMHPREQRGFSFEFTADPTGAPEWRELSGSAATAIVQGNRAELTLSPVGSEARTFVLGFRDGRMVARVDIGPEGTPALSIAAGTRSWYWIGVEHPKAEGSFSWRLASGGSAPGSWARNDRWLGDRGQRIDIPLEPSGQGANRYAVALVDPSTGCGIASSLTRD